VEDFSLLPLAGGGLRWGFTKYSRSGTDKWKMGTGYFFDLKRCLLY